MMEMKCSGCVFTKVKDSKQAGCMLNRIEKLQETNTEEKDGIEYKVLKRFCNTHRPERWLQKITFDKSLDATSTALEEVRPRVGFIVYLDHSKDNPLTWLESTLMDIRDQTESAARYVIVVNEKVEYNQQIHDMLLLFFNKEKTEIHILQLLEVPTNKIWIVDECFRFALNGWIYVTTSGEAVSRSLLQDMHEHINIKMKRLSVVKPYEGINGLLFQTALFKYLNGNKTKIWDEDKKDSRLFLDKIKDLDAENDCILEWSDVNVA